MPVLVTILISRKRHFVSLGGLQKVPKENIKIAGMIAKKRPAGVRRDVLKMTENYTIQISGLFRFAYAFVIFVVVIIIARTELIFKTVHKNGVDRLFFRR